MIISTLVWCHLVVCLVGFGGHLGAVERILLITPLTPPCHLVSMLQQRLYTLLTKKSISIVLRTYIYSAKSRSIVLRTNTVQTKSMSIILRVYVVLTKSRSIVLRVYTALTTSTSTSH